MRNPSELSPEIDSCIPMIAQHARSGYDRLPDHDRRWHDLEDLMQEGFLTALETERQWRRNKGNKFSTHLWCALNWRVKSILASLRHQKRGGTRTTGADGVERRGSITIIELDAPVTQDESDTRRGDNLPDPAGRGQEDSLTHAQRAFEEVFRSVSPGAQAMMVRVLLCGRQARGKQEDRAAAMADIRRAADRLRVSMDQFSLVCGDTEARKKLLLYASECATMRSETEGQLRVLECTECEGQFTLGQLRRKRFYLESMTCRTCLEKLAQDRNSCFGRRKTPSQEGYSLEDAECRLYCNDRRACRQFIQQETIMGAKALEIAKGVGVGDDLEQELAEVDKKSAEAVKAEVAKKKKNKVKAKGAGKVAKPKAKAKTAAKVEFTEPAPPKGVSDWPFKRGSCMRWCVQLCAVPGGITHKEFAKQVEPYAHPAGQLSAIRPGHYPVKGPEFTHLWEFSEEGGKFHITNMREVKPKGAKADPKAAHTGKAKAAAKAGKTKAKTGKAKAGKAKAGKVAA